MNTLLKRGVLVFLVVGFLFVLGGCTPSKAAFYNFVDSHRTAATVNGEKISRKSLNDRINIYKLFSGPDVAKDPNFSSQVLDQLVEETLLLQDVKAQKIEPQKDAFDHAKNLIDYVKNQFGSEEAYQKKLTEFNLKNEDIEAFAKNISLIQSLYAKVTDGLTVDEKEVRDFYDSHKDYFKQPEMVRASHILVDKEEDAKSILNQLKGGADFAQLATKYSKDTATKEAGGDLGFFPRGQMVKEFEDAAFALKPGELSGVVKTSFGYHIIKLVDRRPEQVMAYEDVKDQIKNDLLGDKQGKAFETYINGLKEKARITR
ncbi:MAG: peptidylprolyl isomerase [Firmicutes bacterium]|nr:peptidylprolyl isomerase [Bacillota bacterium]MCL5040207.1 peptidylprolyl isomerase [Bacillota bacterium]